MTYEGDFDEPWDDEFGDGQTEYGGLDERLRDLLQAALPEFSVSQALGDRAIADAARRRARTRALGAAGVVAVMAVGALAVVPLAGWGGRGGGRGAGVADARIAAGAFAASSSSSTPSTTAVTATPSPSPSVSTVAVPTPPPAPTTSGSTSSLDYQAWMNSPKVKAVDRVQNALQSSHQNSFMGVGFSGQDYTDGRFDNASLYDSSPIVVYRKPNTDASLEAAAIKAAAPFKVVFHDTVLDASEQWFLGHRLEQDTDYWKSQGVEFLTSLQNDGTITIFAPDPGTVVPLLEQHYGYTGQVFVGKVMAFHPVATPPVPGSTQN